MSLYKSLAVVAAGVAVAAGTRYFQNRSIKKAVQDPQVIKSSLKGMQYAQLNKWFEEQRTALACAGLSEEDLKIRGAALRKEFEQKKAAIDNA